MMTHDSILTHLSDHHYTMSGNMGEKCVYDWRWDEGSDTITVSAVITGFRVDKWYGMGVMPGGKEVSEKQH